MRLHTSSFVKGMPGIKPLRGYREYLNRHRDIKDAEIEEITKFIDSGKLLSIGPEILMEFVGTFEKPEFELVKLALVMALLEYKVRLTLRMIKDYAFRSQIHTTEGVYIKFLDVLVRKGILIAQNTGEEIEYILQKEVLDSLYAQEA